MSVTISNATQISMPIADSVDGNTEAIEAQTAYMESLAACQAQAQVNIAQTTLCDGPSASDVVPVVEPCCRTETIQDEPEPGAVTERTTCDNGQVTDVITYADGQVCTVNVSSARPLSQIVAYDANGNLCTTDVPNACDPNIPVDYFIPLASDFGNQIFCIPGYTYAFAWTGVTAKNLKEELERFDLEELNDLSLPAGGGDSIRAEVNGVPFSCGVQRQGDFVTLQDGSEAGLDANGNPYYCYLNYETGAGAGLIYAHTVSDPALAVEPPTLPGTTVAFNDLAEPITCDINLHPLQVTQQNQMNGCYAALGMLCEKAEPVEPSPPAAGGDPTGFPNLFPSLIDCDEESLIAGKTAQEAYYTLWEDWWCCEKRSKQMQQYLYWGQLPFAIAGLIESVGTYNQILSKNLSMVCATQNDLDLVAQCSALIQGTEDEPGLLKICQSNLLEGHNDRIGLINNRGMHACDMADDEFDCYEKLWKPIQQEHAPQIASQLQTMLHNGKDTSEYVHSWANGLEQCVTDNMLPELKRQFAPIIQSGQCPANNLNEWRSDLRQKALDLHDHFNNVYKCPEANMIPVIMDMTTCLVQRTCELRDWLYDVAREDQDVYRTGYQAGERDQARAAMGTSAHLIPKIVESVNWLDTNIPAALDIFKTCYADPQAKLNPRLYAEATDLAPEIRRCFDWFKDNAVDYKKFFEDCYQDGECRLVKLQLDLACQLAQRHDESLKRLEQWSLADREMFTRHFQSREIRGLQEVSDNGTRASRELHLFSEWFDNRTKEFHDVFTQHWMPCDIENLKQHCAIWTRGNPLQGIERNNVEMNQMGKELQDFHSDGLAHAKTYLDKVFQDQDEFEYCIESAAQATVQSQIADALKDVKQRTSKYARGHLLAAEQLIKVEGARKLGAAAETADRWKWWANEQMKQRAFDRRVSLMGAIDSAGVRAIEAGKTEVAGYDLLLNHAQQAILRGQNYLTNMQQAGQTTSNIDQNQVDSLLRSVQLMHFWPELALQGQGQFSQAYTQMMDDAQSIIQLGHGWRDAASREKTSASTVMNQSFDVAMRLSQLGQFYLSEAEQMNAQRTQAANTAGTLGNQYAQTGHNLHRLATDSAQTALQQSIGAAQMGLGAGELGHRHVATAMEIENTLTLNALEHIKASLSAFNVGIDFLQEVRQSHELSGSYGLNAANGLLNLFKHGQNNSLLALNANEQCYQMSFEMLCKAKDFLQKNHQLNLTALHGDNTVAATNQLLSQQGDSVGSAFALLGNSLQGLTQNSSPLPFPTGNNAFGFNGSAF